MSLSLRKLGPAVLIAGCHTTPVVEAPSPTASAPRATVSTPATTERPAEETVDWANLDYDGIVSLRDGRGGMREYGEDGLHDSTEWQLLDVVTADLDRDGHAEALVSIAERYAPPEGNGSERTLLYVFDPAGPRLRARTRTAANATLRVAGAHVIVTAQDTQHVLSLRGDTVQLTPREP